MEELKKDGRNRRTGEYPDSLNPNPHSSLFLFVNIKGWDEGSSNVIK